MYLDFAERQALKGVVMNMEDWALKLDAFLQFNEESILKHQGRVSHEVALALAKSEFEKHRIVQDKLFESDFDRDVKTIQERVKELGQIREKRKGKDLGRGR